MLEPVMEKIINVVEFFIGLVYHTAEWVALPFRWLNKNRPKPLPPEIVKAWQAAGATVCWAGIDESYCTPFYFRIARIGKVGEVPAFSCSNVPEDALDKLPDPKRAFAMNLWGTPITGEGLLRLAGLTSLQILQLGDTPVSDADLKHLLVLENLQMLGLRNTNVTDEGLKVLAEHKSLQSLTLSHTRITSSGLKEFAKLKTLQELDLYGTATDADLKGVAALTSLRSLNLTDSRVTDAGLKELVGLANLQRMSVSDWRVTAEAVAELELALPKCKIHLFRRPK
jgi:hypothetical protein